jgi:hypothetical protein
MVLHPDVFRLNYNLDAIMSIRKHRKHRLATLGAGEMLMEKATAVVVPELMWELRLEPPLLLC